MTWAEYELNMIALARKNEREEMLFREVAYQVHCLNYLFGKKRPPKKSKFWHIGKKKESDKAQKQAMKAAFIRAQEEYKEKVSG